MEFTFNHLKMNEFLPHKQVLLFGLSTQLMSYHILYVIFRSTLTVFFFSPCPANILPTSSCSVTGAGQMMGEQRAKAKRTIKKAEEEAEWDMWKVV